MTTELDMTALARRLSPRCGRCALHISQGEPPNYRCGTCDDLTDSILAALQRVHDDATEQERNGLRADLHAALLEAPRLSQRAKRTASDIVWNAVGIRARKGGGRE